ncbi:MAG TPA: hypothetical protein DCM26_02400 [Desulfotomaculum sp.]|jgi:hypothetical protein|nr:hypothetical protein [Desulfotomaculum sp.]
MKGCRKVLTILFSGLLWCVFYPLPILAQEMTQQLPPATTELEYRDEITFNHPNYVEQLDNGNLLVCRIGYRKPEVVELTPAGQQVWSFSGLQASSAQRLSNGNTLIADSGAPGSPFIPRVIEVTPQGQTIWEYRLPSLTQAPRYAEQLPGGNILITLPFKIIEVTRDKKIAWSYGWGRPVKTGTRGYLANPLQATRLANGNILIVDSGLTGGRVFEITPGKDIVWQYGNQQATGPAGTENKPDYLRLPTGALRLLNGNTLIADALSSALLEVSPAGELVCTLSWKDALSGLPVMNQWRVTPRQENKVIVPCTLTNSCSRILVIKLPVFFQ